MRVALTWAVAATLAGCAMEGGGWAVQHGHLTATEDGASGYQVWEFFGADWGRDKGEAHHRCARVQRLVAVPLDVASLSGCARCEVAFTLEVTELEHDCRGAEGAQDRFTGPVAMAFDRPSARRSSDRVFPDDALGWYVSFDGEALEPIGYAWDEQVEWGEVTGEPGGWAVGTTYVLWPEIAWEL